MSQIKAVPAVSIPAITVETDENLLLKQWLSDLQKAENAKNARKIEKEDSTTRPRLYAFD